MGDTFTCIRTCVASPCSYVANIRTLGVQTRELCVLMQTQVNPQLNSSHKFSIDRKHKRAMVRALTRGVKLTLWQHKAMWKDTALGTATLKCEDLETKAEVCDCGWVYVRMYVCEYHELALP